eukprot:1153327-Pelagomonas_calceolata.AAC.3
MSDEMSRWVQHVLECHVWRDQQVGADVFPLHWWRDEQVGAAGSCVLAGGTKWKGMFSNATDGCAGAPSVVVQADWGRVRAAVLAFLCKRQQASLSHSNEGGGALQMCSPNDERTVSLGLSAPLGRRPQKPPDGILT